MTTGNDEATPSTGQVRTYDVLLSLGFVPDPDTMSDDPGALKMAFGGFTLRAIHCLGPRFEYIVMLSGVMASERRIAAVEFHLPQNLASRELGVAWVTWCLDEHAGGEFRPRTPTPWLSEGRKYRHLLPR